MFVRLPKFGALGVISDTVGQALPVGAFTDANNMRFAGIEMQKMLEPTKSLGTDIAPEENIQLQDGTDFQLQDSRPLTKREGGGNLKNPEWLQFWTDGLSSYAAVAASGYLYFWDDNGIDDGVWRLAGGPYSGDSVWQSFAWGDTCIFNNGVDAPQIYNTATGRFEDLPNWGLISTAEDIFNSDPPSKKVQAACTSLQPFKSFLVASGVTESGLYQPNKVWWSDSTTDVGFSGAPNWDYETPASLSGQIEIDPESGSINTSSQLNENLIIYTDASATAMTFVGGTLVMQFRRLFNKGAAGLHCVAEFNNQHFVVAADQIYIHDGSTVNLIAKDRIEEEFYKRLGKGGRFGDGVDINWNDIQVVKNPDRKEILIVFGDVSRSDPDPICVPVSITTQPVDQTAPDLIDPCTVTFTAAASGTPLVTYQWFEGGVIMAGETNSTLTVDCASTSEYFVTVANACGTEISNTVIVGNPDPAIPLYVHGTPYNGLGWHQLVTSDDVGQKILINPRGYGEFYFSTDAGATFPLSSFPAAAPSQAFITSCMGYFQGDWIYGGFGTAAQGLWLNNSADDGATEWTQFAQQIPEGTNYFTYSHAFGIDDSGAIFYLDTGQQGQFNLKSWESPYTGGSYAKIDLGGGQFSGYQAADVQVGNVRMSTLWNAAGPYGAVQYSSGVADYDFSPTIMPLDPERIAGGPLHAANISATDISGGAGLSYADVLFISEGFGTKTSTVNFSAPCASADVDYLNGVYVIHAVDAATRTNLHIISGDYQNWTTELIFQLTYPQTGDDAYKKQLIHWTGDTYLFAYLARVNGVDDVYALDQITFSDPALAIAPLITQNPSPITVTDPASASMTTSATGATGSQWRKGTPPNGVDVVGETGDTITWNPSAVADSGDYYNRYTNANGDTDTDPATLTVQDSALNDVQLMLHMDGTDGSTDFVDSSNFAHTMTENGGVVLSTTQSKWGGASAYWAVSSGIVRTTEFTLDLTSDFTVEGWLYPTAINSVATVYSAGPAANAGIQIYLDASNHLSFGNLTAFGGSGSITVPLNQWTYVCVDYFNGVLYISIGGIADGNWTPAGGFFVSGDQNTVGGQWTQTQNWEGYLDDIRVSQTSWYEGSPAPVPTAPLLPT